MLLLEAISSASVPPDMKRIQMAENTWVEIFFCRKGLYSVGMHFKVIICFSVLGLLNLSSTTESVSSVPHKR